MILTILRVLFLRIRNNPLELALLFVMPVVFFSIFAGIFSKGIATGNDKQLRVGWIASHPTALGAELRGFLDTQSTLQCTSLMAESSPQVPTGDTHENAIEPIQIEATIAEAQRSGRYDLIIRLPDNFPFEMTDDQDSSPCSVQLVTDGQNPIAVAMVTSIVRSFFAEKKLAATAKRMMSLSLAEQSSSRLRGSSSPNQRDVGNAGSKLPPLSAESRSSTSRRRYLDPVKDPSQVFKSDPESPWLVMDSKGAYSVEGVSSGSGAQALALPPNVFTTVDTPGTTRTETTKSTDVENVSISIQNPQAANQENPRIAMYAAGIAVLFLLFSSTGHAAALLEEAESGTLDRILVSQAGLFHIIGGKWLGILLLGCLQITVMFVWAELVFGIQLADHVPGFCIMTFSTAAATASFAMLMATLCKSRAQLNAVSIVLILSMSAVGGSMIPRFVMSDRMKEIGRWTFNAWALDGYQKVFWFQAPLTSLWAEVAVLLGSSLVLGLLALRFSGRWKRS